MTFYCDAECQRKDWSKHQKVCSVKFRETASPCPPGFIDVLIATGVKSTTRFERWSQAEHTEIRSEPRYEDLTRTFRSFDLLRIGPCADAYCEADMYGEDFNGTARSLMLAVDLKPPQILDWPLLIHFHEGVCRQGKTSIELAREWYEAYILDDTTALSVLAIQTNEDRQQHAARVVQKLELFVRTPEAAQSEAFARIKAHAIAEDAPGWELFLAYESYLANFFPKTKD